MKTEKAEKIEKVEKKVVDESIVKSKKKVLIQKKRKLKKIS